jgi:hypothetical protein
MHETLEVIATTTTSHGKHWILAAPVGGGVLQALTPEAAQIGHDEGWLDGYEPQVGLAQARQTQPEA